MTSNPILARFEHSVALVTPEQQMRFEACVKASADFMVEQAERIAAAAQSDDFWPEDDDSWMAWLRPYKVNGQGTLLIPVKGVLLHDFPYAFGDWATGYDYITKAIERGVSDPVVKQIALVENSPGGEVAGCFECAEKIEAASKEKPVRAFAHESAYSAAYAIAASAGDGITVSRTGGVGSIGVVTMHVDYSKMMDRAGVTVTFIHAGKHKVDGNPYEPLPDAVKARIQSRIDEMYSVFVSHVARNRGMEEGAVRATEALTFTASEALSNGLADAIGPFDESLASFEAELSNDMENETMSKEQDNSATENAAAEIETVRAEAAATGRTEGAKAERERIGAIMGSDEAKSRPVAANNVAMDTDMSVDAAKAFLAKMPVEGETIEATGAGAGSNRFDNAMSKGNPDLSANDTEETVEGDGFTGTAGKASLVSARKAATGF